MAVLGSHKQTKVAAFLAVALLATVLVPLNMVSADTHSHANGYIVVFEPESGDLDNGQLFVDATDGVYTFHVSVYDGTGAPVTVTQYGLVVLGLDAANDPATAGGDKCGTASGHPQCIYVSGGTNAEDNTFTVKIPVTQVAFLEEMPGNGIGLYAVLHKGAGGVSLANADGSFPTGYYNPGTATALAAESYAEADELDYQSFPIVLRNAFIEGLVQAGNPVLNPGFEISIGEGVSNNIGGQAANYGFSTEMPPWFLFIDDGAGGSSQPASAHFLATNCGAPGEAGSCASIHVDDSDFGENLIFGQFFAPPQSGVGVWRAGEALTLEFDTRTNHDYGWKATTTVHYIDGLTGAEKAVTLNGETIPGGYDWTHVTYDFSAIPADSILTSFFLSLNWDWFANPIVLFDNVAISGATLAPQVNLQNDLNDGYSSFIHPLGAAAGPTGVMTQDLVSLNGDAYYVYEVIAEDYTMGTPMDVDLQDGRHFQFELLDEQYVLGGMGRDNSLYVQQNGQFRLLDENGDVTKNAYVLVPADAVGESTRVVPWVYKDIATGDTYENTFGTQSEPVSGYHSLLRNGMRGAAIADHFDYAFTPVILSNAVGSSLVSSSTLTLACDGIVPGQACLNDPTPIMRANFTTTSRVLETVTIELVAESNRNLVLASGQLQVPSGSIEFELSEASMDLMRAEAPDLRVIARTAGALFAGAAESNIIRLDNIIPLADFAISPSEGATDVDTFVVQDASTDADGTIVRRTWIVNFLADSTPDEDETVVGAIVSHAGASNLRSFSFNVPDDGTYEVVLLAEDNDGGSSTITKQFEAVNVAPTGSLSAPAFLQPNVLDDIAATIQDVDGLLKEETVAWTSSDPANTTIVPILGGATVAFAVDGEYTLTVTFADDDGAIGTASATIVVDGIGATTALSIPAAPSTGWFTEAVDVAISRADERSGVAHTRVLVDGLGLITTEGDTDYVRTVSAEGRHLVTAESRDRAGNLGALVSVEFNIDTSAPTVELSSQSNLPALPFSAYNKGDAVTLSADAQDTASGVERVSFYRGEVLIGTDTDGSDGWGIVWDTTYDTGMQDVIAIATDAAGHTGQSEPMKYFILDI